MGCKQSKAVESGLTPSKVSKDNVLNTTDDAIIVPKRSSRNKKNNIGIEKASSTTNSKGNSKSKVKSFRNIANRGNENSLTSNPVGTHETLPETGSSSVKERNNNQDGQQTTNSNDKSLFQMLVDTVDGNNNSTRKSQPQSLDAIIRVVTVSNASYLCPKTHSTPLHIAVRLLDHEISLNTQSKSSDKNSVVVNLIDALIRAHPFSVAIEDKDGNIPLHYAIAPTVYPNPRILQAKSSWKTRTSVARLLLSAEKQVLNTFASRGISLVSKSTLYLKRNDVIFEPYQNRRRYYSTDDDDEDEEHGGMDLNNHSGGCSPLYRAIQTLPDDFGVNSATLDYIHLLLKTIVGIDSNTSTTLQNNNRGTDIVCRGNASDGDKPLALLYRRFTRQFDLAEKFFSGDNSRTEVVEHRKNYKQAAGNTWKIIDLVLQYQEQPYDVVSRQNYRTVHRAVQGETPPDLLRYIVETNAEDLTIPDESGNLPLHHAAKARPPSAIYTTGTIADYKASFPAFYSKYVIDELLYKYPEAASIQDAAGFYPLTLAVKSGKQWIGGGIKSLYDAYPDALSQINLDEHSALKLALSSDVNNRGGDDDEYNDVREEKKTASPIDLIRDELHDAIMLVQQENVDISEVVASMWAHEEDAGVQMLGCVAVARLIRSATQRTLEYEKYASSSSPNTFDPRAGSPISNHYSSTHSLGNSTLDDVMRIALCAVPAVVNAMKAHPNEIIVQEKACSALKGMAWADGKREISFVASGAVAAIIGAMQAHVSDQNVQEEACGAIGRIIRYGGPDRATIVASVSGLTAIINAIAAHPTSIGVQKDGCRALRELTEYSSSPDANVPDIPRSQTESLLETAKQNFPNECTDVVNILLSRLT